MRITPTVLLTLGSFCFLFAKDAASKVGEKNEKTQKTEKGRLPKQIKITAKKEVVNTLKSKSKPVYKGNKDAVLMKKIRTEMALKNLKFKKSLTDITNEITRLSSVLKLMQTKAAVDSLSEDTVAKMANIKTQISLLKSEFALISVRRKIDDMKFQESFLEQSREVFLMKQEINAAKIKRDFQRLQLLQQREQLADKMAIKELAKEESRNAFNKVLYLADPLVDGNTLVLSDRVINFSGPITYGSDNFINERIDFFNNKDGKKPIFLVIDSSPGGSVVVGLNILAKMHGSQAPVYVVVKKFAASMAAAICTLAERSFAYPNALIMHHQVLSSSSGNLAEQQEQVALLEKFWKKLGGPIAKKMGITIKKFRQMMYENTVTGDWMEFATEAQKIKWVDNIINKIENPNITTEPVKVFSYNLFLKKEEELRTLPPLKPYDAYYISNKKNYYKVAK